MVNELVLTNVEDNIAYLTLNSPEQLNVLSEQMMNTLLSCLGEIEQDPDVRCVVIKANGRAYCAGHNLAELSTQDCNQESRKNDLKQLFELCSSLMIKLKQIPQPVIAQVQGVAVAAGCQLVASCDLAIAGHGAKFGVNGVNIGLFCSTPMVALTRNVPRKVAFELLCTGKIIDSQTAHNIGLVNKVVPDNELAENVKEMALTIASKLTEVVKIGKEAFYEQANMTLENAYQFAGDVMVTNLENQNTIEGINAFLEKRAPIWDKQK